MATKPPTRWMFSDPKLWPQFFHPVPSGSIRWASATAVASSGREKQVMRFLVPKRHKGNGQGCRGCSRQASSIALWPWDFRTSKSWDRTLGGNLLSHRGTPSYHPFIDGIFRYCIINFINDPFLGTPMTMETPIYQLTTYKSYKHWRPQEGSRCVGFRVQCTPKSCGFELSVNPPFQGSMIPKWCSASLSFIIIPKFFPNAEVGLQGL